MIPSRFLAMFFALVLLFIGLLWPATAAHLSGFFAGIAPGKPEVDAALCLLFFAAALQLRVNGKPRVLASATLLTLLATLIAITVIAHAARWVFSQLGIEVEFVYCLMFAALIAPADPLAMLRTLQLGGAAPSLTSKVVAEPFIASLCGLSFFSVLLAGPVTGTADGMSSLLMQQIAGGLLFGACLGLLGLYALRQLPRFPLALATGVIIVAASWGGAQTMALSGPFAAAVAGLILTFQDEAGEGAVLRDRLADICQPVVEVVIALLLFALVLSIVAEPIPVTYLVAAVFILPVVVLARAIVVSPLARLLRYGRDLPEELPKIVAWGGLRGGLAAALALSLPAGGDAQPIQTVVFLVLGFAILIQAPLHGLAMVSTKPLAESSPPSSAAETPSSD